MASVVWPLGVHFWRLHEGRASSISMRARVRRSRPLARSTAMDVWCGCMLPHIPGGDRECQRRYPARVRSADPCGNGRQRERRATSRAPYVTRCGRCLCDTEEIQDRAISW